jgi:5'-nucleotidase
MIRHPILTCLAPLLLGACAGPMAGGQAAGPVTVGILAINDFHGSLEPPKSAVAAPDGKGGTISVPAGGAAWLASAIGQLRGKYAYSATVSAGDLIGASQLASSLFLDEPAVGAMNRVGLDFNAVGNHEFDRGRAELLRMQNGGCAKHTSRQPCRLERFAGANFRFLAAGTKTESGAALFPATGIKRFGAGRRRVAVGFIGLTLRDTPLLVFAGGVAGLTFGDEAAAINAQVPRLKRQGADAIVVLIHQGGRTAGPPDPDGCEGLNGDIVPILARLDPLVDVVVSGHTHSAYVCDYGKVDLARPILLTSAGVYGKLVTDIAIEIDPAANRVVGKRASNVIVQSEPYGAVSQTALVAAFSPDPALAAYVRRYTDAARTEALRPAGKLAGPAAGPALGNLIADAQLAATRGSGAQIALTNPFGIRAALAPEADGTVRFGDLFKVQPFDNQLVTQTMTGAELRAGLEQGFDATGPVQALAASAGFTYRYDRSRAAGHRIVEVMLEGAPLRDDASYRVTTNSFLAMGGDGFSGFTTRRAAVPGSSDVAALEAWLKADPPRAAPPELRAVEIKP